MTTVTTDSGWQYDAVMFQGRKPIAWIGSHPNFSDRAGDVLCFDVCPLCNGTEKIGEEICQLCKEDDTE